MHRLIALLFFSGLLLPAAASEPVVSKREPASPEIRQEEERLKERVAYLLTLSDDEIRAIVPKDSRGIFWTTCPKCNKRSRVALWKWEPQHPHQIECSDCHTRFPHAEFPDPEFLEVEAVGGPIRFHYYTDRKTRYFLRATADYRARSYMADGARDLARLYALTGEEDLARRALVILAEFARVFPRYPYIYDGGWHGREVQVFSSQVPVPESPLIQRKQPCRWSFWGYMDLPQEFLYAYDDLQKWPGLQTEHGRKVIADLTKNVFDPQIAHVQSFAEDHRANMSISAQWPNFLHAARLLNRPELYSDTLKQLAIFEQQSFLYDGSWWETSPSYANQILRAGLSRLQDAITGKDNDGTPPATPFFTPAEAVARSLVTTRTPAGRLLPLNDTWSFGTPYPSTGARERSESILWPGLGVAIQGAGSGSRQWQSYLNFTSGRSHKHADTLSFGLMINDKELYSDIGYTHTRYQPWASATHSHNTVVVDGKSSAFDLDHTGNRLVHYFTDPQRFHLCSARSLSAYPGTTSRYERTLALIGRDARDAFLIDLFEVEGGHQHDYLLHGSADEDSTARLIGVEAGPYAGNLMAPGATFTLPTIDRASVRKKRDTFGYVNTLHHAPSPGGVVELVIKLDAMPKIGTRTFLVTGKGDALFLGKAPSVRRATVGHLKEDDSRLDDYQAPFFSWRRSGQNLRSTFAAVHQPLGSGRPIRKVTSSSLGGHGILLHIEYGENESVYFAHSDTPEVALEVETAHGPFRLEGSIGFVRMAEGGVKEARLIAGKTLSLGDYRLEGKGSFQGELLHASLSDQGEQLFELNGTLPPAEAPGVLILTFPDATERAYNVEQISSGQEGRTVVRTRETSGFTFSDNNIRITSYPQRDLPGGTLRYRLAPMATYLADQPN